MIVRCSRHEQRLFVTLAWFSSRLPEAFDDFRDGGVAGGASNDPPPGYETFAEEAFDALTNMAYDDGPQVCEVVFFFCFFF